jgi:phage terminase large subunit-like protein
VIYEEYIKDVLSGKRTAGKMERQGVERFQRLRRKYEFDESEAERILNIVHSFRHTKGKWLGKHFNLLPHQAFFFASIFGLKRSDGTRLIREATLCTSKKSGKSEIGGAVGALMTYFDGEMTAECYAVANKVEQALYCWKAAKKIITQLADEYPDFASRVKFYDNQQSHILLDTETDSFFKAIPTDGKTLDGVNPHLAIIDEYHEAIDSQIPDNMVSGMVLRDQPLLLFVTTRGFHPYGPLAQKEEYYANILNGFVADDSVMPLIYSFDDGDDWTNKSLWLKCNPGLPELPTYEALEEEQSRAIEEGGEKLVSCRTKNFNMWQRSQEQFIEPEIWDACKRPFTEDDLAGRRCIAALDLGQTNDLTALGYLFYPESEGEPFYFFCRFFMPSELIEVRSRQHRVSYRQWIDEGVIIPTPGNITDTAFVTQVIREDFTRFQVEKLVADQSFALELLNSLLSEGYPVENYPQRFATMNAPVLKVQSMAIKGELAHDGNKCLAWMCSNVALKRNTGGQVMMDKSDRVTAKGKDAKRGRKKIDGMVVLAMCVGVYLESIKDETSAYNSGERDGFLML